MTVEIITGIERRRRWRMEEKLRIIAEVERPGACFADVARRHDVSRGLLWNWRRQLRREASTPGASLQFVPVQVLPEAPPERLEGSTPRKRSAADDAVIEIALADGTTVRVGRDVGTVALRRVLGVLRG